MNPINRHALHALLGAFCLSLLACTTPATFPDRPVIAASSPMSASTMDENGELFSYYQKIRLSPQAEIGKTLLELNGLSKTPYREMQRAMLLGLLHGSGDLARAQAILDGILKSNDAASDYLKPAAHFLTGHNAELRRFDEVIEKQNQQLKEVQRRADQLAQKLEDIKTIERQLPSRPRNPLGSSAASAASGSEAKP